ncbi:MAG: 3-isopropylmalate dehydratase [Alphaproteobacteria bacterium]|nr:3-isopropylmalate dehydratase [Alphaproteobacteria bacterium]
MNDLFNDQISGRVWVVGDDINTDLILPIQAYYLPVEQQPAWVFSANRPGWSGDVGQGDILVAGQNFDVGSSRPAARSLKNHGLACLLADSINGLFYRNAINFAFPALEAPGVTALFKEGDRAEISFEAARIANPASGKTLDGVPMPAQLLAILQAGGIYSLLQSENLIR